MFNNQLLGISAKELMIAAHIENRYMETMHKYPHEKITHNRPLREGEVIMMLLAHGNTPAINHHVEMLCDAETNSDIRTTLVQCLDSKSGPTNPLTLLFYKYFYVKAWISLTNKVPFILLLEQLRSELLGYALSSIDYNYGDPITIDLTGELKANELDSDGAHVMAFNHMYSNRIAYFTNALTALISTDLKMLVQSYDDERVSLMRKFCDDREFSQNIFYGIDESVAVTSGYIKKSDQITEEYFSVHFPFWGKIKIN
jgi:hypothetical protein